MSNFAELIYGSNGQHFRCEFEKKNGELRKLYGCLRPKENSKGLKYSPKDYGLICVYDLEAEGYRMINIEGLKQVDLLDEDFEPIESGCPDGYDKYNVVVEDEDYTD